LNNRGFSLLELIIYIVLLGLVVSLISSPFKTMLKSYSGTKNIVNLQNSTRDILSMITREVRNTGLKRLTMNSGGVFSFSTIANTYLSDSSSFILKQGSPGDTLIIYKANLDDAGQSNNIADSVKFYLNGNVLIRNLNGTEIGLDQDIYALQFRTGLLASDSMLLKSDTFTTTQWAKSGVAAAMSVDSTNLLVSYSGAGSGYITSANTFSLNSSRRISVNFRMSNRTGMPDNVDSMAWAVLNSSNTQISRGKFKPGLTDDKLILSVPGPVSSAKIQLQTYCKAVASLRLDYLEVRAIDRGGYTWCDTVATGEKRNVRAIEIFVLMRSSVNTDTKITADINVANVTVSRSGSYAWRLLTETVEIPNNGLF
jgi:hypothetical protein